MRQVLLHAETRPDESLGVIAMGIKHANRVQAALDRALDSGRTSQTSFSLDRNERFFVKNLETVQGDERDAIIFNRLWRSREWRSAAPLRPPLRKRSVTVA